MSDIGKLRKRIERAKADLARTEGERAALNDRIEECVGQLREHLDCGAGEEKEAIKELRDKVDADEAELSELLDEVEKSARDE